MIFASEDAQKLHHDLRSRVADTLEEGKALDHVMTSAIKSHTFRTGSDEKVFDSSTIPAEDEAIEKGTRLFVCKRIDGNHRLVYGKPRGRKFPFHCLLGPDWCCSFVTITLILIPSFFALCFAAPFLGLLAELTGLVSFVACLGSFMVTAFSDPGILKKQAIEALDRDFEENPTRVTRKGLFCNRCNIYRPYTAVHCYDCDACIEEYDHHCPWTGHCIGKGNLQWFYSFLLTLVLHFVYVVIVLNLWLLGDPPSQGGTVYTLQHYDVVPPP